MRTDAIDLDIGGNQLRVVCEDSVAAGVLRSALAHHVIESPTPVGFSLQVPKDNNKLHVLLDRSGFVLARARTAHHVLAVLGSHLGALLPPPTGTVRIRARALLSDDSRVVLAGFPLFVDPPVVERRLERASYSIIDRVAVDIRPDGVMEMSPTPWPAMEALSPVRGHSPAPVAPTPVDLTLVPRVGDEDPSQAIIVAFLASSMATGPSIESKMALAEHLAARRVVAVPLDDRAARYASLER